MPTVEFVGQSSRDSDNIAANPSRLVNFYRSPAAPGGRTGFTLKSVPGTTEFAAIDSVFVRALETQGDYLYAATGGRLYSIDADGVIDDLGAVENSAETSISGNNGVVTVAAGGEYYVWDGATLTQPTAGAFSDFGSVEYISNYTVLTQRNGRMFQWSDIADATDLPGLNFATADGRDDNLLRAVAINGLLYLFKEASHEVWYVTGGAGAEAFERQVGGVADIGLKAFGLITRFDGGAFLVGDDSRAYVVMGGLQRVSMPAVETALKYNTPVSCFTYEDEGHTFCAISFADCPAWVYDMTTGEWHERAQGLDLGPWGARVSARLGGDWYVGHDDGTIYSLGRVNADNITPPEVYEGDVFEDGVFDAVALVDRSDPMIREAISRPLYLDGQRFILREFELFPRVGFADATIEVSFSRDGGITWGQPRQVSFTVGDYDKRVIFRALGQSRNLVARIRVSDAAEVSINAEGRVAV